MNRYGNAVPTIVTLTDGTTRLCRSKTEARWLTALDDHCQNLFICYECEVIRTVNKHRSFVSYTPDILVVNPQLDKVYIEIKSDRQDALEDQRGRNALRFKPDLKIVVLGGQPHSDYGFFVRMISSSGERTFEDVRMEQLADLLGCDDNPKFRGVYQDKSTGLWIARIQFDGQRMVIGRHFETAKAAAIAYDAHAIAVHGPKAKLNFPLPPQPNYSLPW